MLESAVRGARKTCVVHAAQVLADIEGRQTRKIAPERIHTRFVHNIVNAMEKWLVEHTGARAPKEVMKYPNYGYLTKVLEVAAHTQCDVVVEGAEVWVEKFGHHHVDVEWYRCLVAMDRRVATDLAVQPALREVQDGLAKVAVADLHALSPTAVLKEIPQRPDGVVLTKVDGMVNMFSNRCPHVGLTLEDMSGRVHCAETSFIKCSAHGALFDPATGYCTDGPCADEFLHRVPFSVVDSQVMIDTPTVADYVRTLASA